MMLGDFGADVIKVERRVTGDQSRGWGPPFVGTESAYFLAANRNKRSLSLDYDHPLGAAILNRLLATADVFLINQRNPGSLKRRGLDPESVCARHPRLIYCAISGFGQSGPRSGLAGYDIIAQAQAGIMSFTGEPEGEPVRYPIAIADMACGLYSTIGILAALLAREKTGVGQALDMALFDSQLTLLINAGSNYLNAGESPQRWGNAHPSIVPYQVFRAGDGRHFVAAIGTDALWLRLLRVIDATQTLGADPRFLPMHCGRNIASADSAAVRYFRACASGCVVEPHDYGEIFQPRRSKRPARHCTILRLWREGLIVEIQHPTLRCCAQYRQPCTAFCHACFLPPAAAVCWVNTLVKFCRVSLFTRRDCGGGNSTGHLSDRNAL